MPFSDAKVIIASPNADFRSQIHKMLVAMHWPAEEAMGGADALNKIEGKSEIEAVLLDHWLPDLDVSDLEHSLRIRYPAMDVVLVDLESTEPGQSNRAPVHARTEELFWALRKRSIQRRPVTAPMKAVDGHQDASALSKLLSPSKAVQAVAPIASALNAGEIEFERLPGLIGSEQKMAQVSRLVRLVAPRKSTVLITGETGTGKEVVARALHELSRRPNLVIVNCAAIPDTLLESELFGYSKGAFTGAIQPKLGRIQSADGGTLFLDEVGDLPAGLQAKLLRFLQEGEVQRLGSNEMTKVDVRVIAATNADLIANQSGQNSGDSKSFRQDLYYRLAVFPIELPPLRHRRGDVPALAAHFLAHLCKQDNIPTKGIDAAASSRLMSYNWPGNVRELQHVIERGFILAQDENVLTPEHLPALQFSELS